MANYIQQAKAQPRAQLKFHSNKLDAEATYTKKRRKKINRTMLCGCDVGLMLFRPKLKSFFFYSLSTTKINTKSYSYLVQNPDQWVTIFFNITSLLPTTLFVFPTVVLKTGSVEQRESLCQWFRQIGIEHFEFTSFGLDAHLGYFNVPAWESKHLPLSRLKARIYNIDVSVLVSLLKRSHG